MSVREVGQTAETYHQRHIELMQKHHYMMVIIFRLTLKAGLEIGPGMSINPSMPEEYAQFLNDPVCV
jgi:hypothetical protein